MLHNPYLRTAIMAVPLCGERRPVHTLLHSLIKAVRDHNRHEVYNSHIRLFQLIKQLYPELNNSYMNDAHEAFVFLMNALHKESKFVIPDSDRAHMNDPVSQALLKEYHNEVSLTLQCIVSCQTRVTRDNTVLYETFTTIFVEPELDENSGLCQIQTALQKLNFVCLPKCLYISLITSKQEPCNLTGTLHIHGKQYDLLGIVFYKPDTAHYLCAVQSNRTSKSTVWSDEHSDPTGSFVNAWYVFNDNYVSHVPNHELNAYVQALPSFISYIERT